jgi:hypothetical protein
MAADLIHPYDIVIPCGPQDEKVLSQCVESIKKFTKARQIYLLAHRELEVEGCISISESSFPFSKSDVMQIHGENPRNGWYLQQLLKLYFPFVVKEALDHFIVIDADTLLQREAPVFYQGEITYFNFGDEYHAPYFQHMSKIHPSLKRVDREKSGICHLMPFHRERIRELFQLVQNHHRGKVFWKVFLESVEPEFVSSAGASEYEIYFSFMQIFHSSTTQLRQLAWANVSSLDEDFSHFDYVSFHWYRR